MGLCYACRTEVVVREQLGRRDTCPQCGEDLRCCLNCTFYEVRAADACREPTAEPVQAKDRANFCEFFEFRKYAAATPTRSGDVRAHLEALFRKKA